jgi:hypothetical protein
MADTDVQVTFSGDASGVTKAAADARSAIQTLSPAVEAASKSLAGLKSALETAMSPSAQLAAANKKAADDFKKSWDGAVDPVVSNFTRGMVQMAEGSKSFGQVMRGVGQQILNEFVSQVVNKMLEAWLWKELGQTAATQVGVAQRTAAGQLGAAQTLAISGIAAIKQVGNDAAKAFSGAYSALVGVPIVGPAIAPAAATAASGAVLAVQGTIASAAGGYDVPAGVDPLSQLHQREMVLPATLANPLRQMLTDYSASGAGPAGAGGHAFTFGDTHINGAKGDPAEFKQLLAQHRDHMMDLIYSAFRSGSRPPAGVTIPTG